MPKYHCSVYDQASFFVHYRPCVALLAVRLPQVGVIKNLEVPGGMTLIGIYYPFPISSTDIF